MSTGPPPRTRWRRSSRRRTSSPRVRLGARPTRTGWTSTSTARRNSGAVRNRPRRRPCSFVHIPLTAQKKVIGVMVFCQHQSPAFVRDAQVILDLVQNQVTIVVDNARLVRGHKAAGDNRRADQDLQPPVLPGAVREGVHALGPLQHRVQPHHAGHRPLQERSTTPTATSAVTRYSRVWRPSSRAAFAPWTWSHGTAARSSPFFCPRPAGSRRCRPPRGFDGRLRATSSWAPTRA